MNIIDKLNDLKKQRAELEAQLLAGAKEAFHETTQQIFKDHPKLEWFRWRQYTPYFNDGDECVFGANTDYLEVRHDGQDHEDLSVSSFKYRDAIMDNTDLKAVSEKLEAMFSVLDDAALKELFGDHKQITVSRSGVDVDDYEHD